MAVRIDSATIAPNPVDTGGRYSLQVGVTYTPEAYTLRIDPTQTARIRKTYPNNNYNTATDLLVGLSGYGSQYERTLLDFDLSRIPADAVITQATLYMYGYYYQGYEGEVACSVDVYKITAAWKRASVTWNSHSAACVKVSSHALNMARLTGASGNGWKSYTITGSIQACLGASDYHGILLRDATETSQVLSSRKNFYDTTYSNGSYGPYLMVNYSA